MSNHFTEVPAKRTAAQTMARSSVGPSAHLLEGLEFLSAVLQLTGKGLWGDSFWLGSGGDWDLGGVSVLAGLFEMGPLPLPLNLASLIAGTHLQRSAEARTSGLRTPRCCRRRPGWGGVVEDRAGRGRHLFPFLDGPSSWVLGRGD